MIEISELTAAIAIADGCEVEPHVGDNRWVCTCGSHGDGESLIIPLTPTLDWCVRVLKKSFLYYNLNVFRNTFNQNVIELKTKNIIDQSYVSQYLLVQDENEAECLARMLLAMLE